MTAPVPVTVQPRSRRAAGLALGYLPPGAVLQLEDGQLLRVQPAGELDGIVLGGRPHGGIGEDPSAGRSAARAR